MPLTAGRRLLLLSCPDKSPTHRAHNSPPKFTRAPRAAPPLPRPAEGQQPNGGANAVAPAPSACSWAARPVPNPYPLGRPNPDPGTWHQCGAAAARLGFRPAGWKGTIGAAHRRGAEGADSRRRRRGCSTWGGPGRGSTTARGAALAIPATPQGKLESAAQQHLHLHRSDSCGPTARGAAAWGPSRVRPPALRRPLPPSSML
ncbi:hypothetical protein PLESTF_001010600 [Pleodorina starrii]|nr:hypothetical protein PLESTF_001010600 [Pleodorina starrii]